MGGLATGTSKQVDRIVATLQATCDEILRTIDAALEEEAAESDGHGNSSEPTDRKV